MAQNPVVGKNFDKASTLENEKIERLKQEEIARKKAHYTGISETEFQQLDGMPDKSLPATSKNNKKKSKFLMGKSTADKVLNPFTSVVKGVLYSQMDVGSSSFYPSQDFELSFDTYDCQGADDFIVTDGPWEILIVRFFGNFILPDNGPVETFNIFFYQNNAGVPGTLIESYTSVSYEEVSGLYTCILPGGPLSLADGSYWISIQAQMNFGSSGQWGWTGHASPQIGLEAHWQNPGDGIGTGATSWTPLNTALVASDDDFTFELLDGIPPIGLIPEPFCQAIDGSFEAGENILYEMFLYASETYNFSTCANDLCCGGSSAANIDFTLYNEAEDELFYIDGAEACGWNATTYGTAFEDWSPATDGYYYLQVDDKLDAAGSFTMAYINGGATVITPAAECNSVSGTIGAGEIAYYRIDMNTTSAYNFSLCDSDPTCPGSFTSAGSGEGDLYLLDKDGNQLFYIDGFEACGWNASTWGSIYQSYIPEYDGCHYVVVADYNDAGGTFDLAFVMNPCLAPVNLNTTEITLTTAKLGWDPGDAETEWTIEYGLAPFDPGTGAGTIINYTCGDPCDYFYTIGSLVTGSSYQWSIRSECSNGYSSDWVSTFFMAECQLECPIGGIDEGEPDIQFNQPDITNGGCNFEPPLFTSISIGDTYCGKVNTYVFATDNTRDSDWYRLDVSDQSAVFDFTWTVEAEFPLLLYIIDSNGDDCDNYDVLASGTSDACQTLSLTVTDLDPDVYYFWVGPSVWTGLDAASGPHKYNATLTSSVIPVYNISGNVNYNNTGNTPIDQSKVELHDDSKALLSSVLTDDAGFYKFTVEAGTYNLNVSTLKPRGGTDLNDQSLTRQFLLGQLSLSSMQQFSADVDANGLIGLPDIVEMGQYIDGQISGWAAEDWWFEEATISVSDANVNKNLKGLCSGDPDMSYIPPAGSYYHDDCEFALPISCGEVAFGQTITATIDGPGKACNGSSVGPDVWYLFAGTGEYITASLCGAGTDYDTKIDIYTGTCGALSSVACNDDYCYSKSQVSWQSVSGTDYYIRVHGFSGETGNFELDLSCGESPLYCLASANVCDEYIAQVVLNTINNSSSCGFGNYQDFTGISTDLSIGNSYSITIANGTVSIDDDLGVWIDWNQDGDFEDSGENVVCDVDSGGEGTFSITVPSGAELGSTTMRIRIKYNGSDCGSPCGITEFGEVEDYSVNVIP